MVTVLVDISLVDGANIYILFNVTIVIICDVMLWKLHVLLFFICCCFFPPFYLSIAVCVCVRACVCVIFRLKH